MKSAGVECHGVHLLSSVPVTFCTSRFFHFYFYCKTYSLITVINFNLYYSVMSYTAAEPAGAAEEGAVSARHRHRGRAPGTADREGGEGVLVCYVMCGVCIFVSRLNLLNWELRIKLCHIQWLFRHAIQWLFRQFSICNSLCCVCVHSFSPFHPCRKSSRTASKSCSPSWTARRSCSRAPTAPPTWST